MKRRSFLGAGLAFLAAPLGWMRRKRIECPMCKLPDDRFGTNRPTPYRDLWYHFFSNGMKLPCERGKLTSRERQLWKPVRDQIRRMRIAINLVRTASTNT
jgi:hypothetical protein